MAPVGEVASPRSIGGTTIHEQLCPRPGDPWYLVLPGQRPHLTLSGLLLLQPLLGSLLLVGCR